MRPLATENVQFVGARNASSQRLYLRKLFGAVCGRAGSLPPIMPLFVTAQRFDSRRPLDTHDNILQYDQESGQKCVQAENWRLSWVHLWLRRDTTTYAISFL
jgi:hypothetical protein